MESINGWRKLALKTLLTTMIETPNFQICKTRFARLKQNVMSSWITTIIARKTSEGTRLASRQKVSEIKKNVQASKDWGGKPVDTSSGSQRPPDDQRVCSGFPAPMPTFLLPAVASVFAFTLPPLVPFAFSLPTPH